MMIPACIALTEMGIEVATYNQRNGNMTPIRRLKEEDEISFSSEAPILYTKLESRESVFLDIDIMGDGILTDEEYAQIKMPVIDDEKALYVSGKLPNWLMASICVSSGAREIYVFEPGNGYTCVKSDDEKNLGKNVKDIPGIDVRRYQDDKMNDCVEQELTDYIYEDCLTVEDQEYLESIRRIEDSLEIESRFDIYDDNEPSRIGHGRSGSINGKKQKNISKGKRSNQHRMVKSRPKRNIMLQEFSVTATEALITYLAFLEDIDYEITIYQVATEPHVKNLIDFLNAA